MHWPFQAATSRANTPTSRANTPTWAANTPTWAANTPTTRVRAGCNAGAAMVVGVLTGGQTAAQLGVERHTHLLPSVAEIPALLAQ